LGKKTVHITSAVFLLLLFLFPCSVQGQVSYSETHYELEGIVPENQCKEIVLDKNGYYWIITFEGTLLRWNGSSFVFGGGNNRFETNKNLPFFWHCNLSADGTPYFKPRGNDFPVYYIDSSSHVQKYISKDSTVSGYLHAGDFIVLKKNWADIARLNDSVLFEKFRHAFLYNDSFQLHLAVNEEQFYLVNHDAIVYYGNGLVKEINFPGPAAAKRAWLADGYLVMNNGAAYDLYKDGVKAGSGRLELLKQLTGTGTKFCKTGRSLFVTAGNTIYRLSVVDHFLQAGRYLELPVSRRSFNSIHADEAGKRLIVAETTGGFSVFEENLLKYLNTQADPEKNIVVTLCPYKDGFLTNQDFQDKVQDGMQAQRFYNPFVLTPSGNFFYPTVHGFFLFDKNKKLKQRWEINTPDFVTSLARIGQKVYIAAGKLWVYNMEANQVGKLNCKPALNDTDAVRNVTEGPPGSAYLVINADLFVLDLASGKRFKLSKDTIPSGYIRSLYFDREYNTVFIAVKNKGLFHADLSSGKIRAFPIERFPELYSCHYMLKDKDGDYWLPTNTALYLLYKDQLEAFIKNKTRFINYYRFGKGHGMGNDEFNGGLTYAGMYLRDSLFLSSMHGIVSFSPAQLKKLSTTNNKSKILVYEVQVDDSVYTARNSIQLPPDYKFCTVRLDFPYISMPGALLEYQLTGIKDSSWLPVGNQSEIVLRNLSPGNYSLRVRVHNQPYVDMLIVNIEARQFWYKKRIVFIAAMVLAAGLILLLLNWRIQRIRNKSLIAIDRHRRELFTIISHDLRSPLTAYQGIADVISYLLKKKDFDRIGELAAQIDTKGVKLNLLMNNLLKWNLLQEEKPVTKNEQLDLLQLLQEHTSIYSEISALKGITILVSDNGHATIEADRDLLSLIIRNLLDNAIKNAVKGIDIDVSLGTEEDNLVLKIGNAFSPDKREKLEKVKFLLEGNKTWEPGADGMGIGLRMVHLAAQKTGSVVKITIEENKATFSIYFDQAARFDKD
jgi:signal transduction histidine kinase